MQAYNKIDQKLHWLSQLVTKVNISYVPLREDNSHTNLYYDKLGNRLIGRWISITRDPLILSLNLKDLQFEWLNSSLQTVKQYHVAGKTIEDLEQEIVDHLDVVGLDPKGFERRLHYEIPSYPFSSSIIEELNGTDLNVWTYYRNIANQACSLLLGYLQIEGEIRIWPHHFDTGIYVINKNKLGIGFGLAMQDTLMDSPYFYLSGYASNGSISYKNLPPLSAGKWRINEDWRGAVLPLSELDKISKANGIESVEQFMLETVAWFITQKV